VSDTPHWRRLRRLWKGEVRADVEEELRFHLDMRAEDLAASGWPRAVASIEASRQFGDLAGIRETCVAIDQRRTRRADLWEGWRGIGADFRLAARALARAPGLAITAVACIGLGVAVTTTIFSAVHALLIRPLPYARAEDLVAVYSQNPVLGAHGSNISFPDYLSWRDRNRTFSALGMYTWNTLTLSGQGDPERVEGASVTANLFPLLGVRPIVGRSFIEGEDRPGSSKVMLLGYALWQRRFGGDRSIVGRSVMVDGELRTIVGVMPPGFSFPDRGSAWVPLAADAAHEQRDNRYFAGAIGRVKPGVSLAQTREDLASLSRRLAVEFPKDNEHWAAEAITLREDMTGDVRKPLLIFFGAVGLVLLIACGNVANLMLARAEARRREMAIRAAIGAGRLHLVRQVLVESLTIALAGGAAGALLAAWGVRLLRVAFPADVPFYDAISLDGAVLAFAALVAMAAAMLFGLAPALRAGRVDLNASLRAGAAGGGGGGTAGRGRARALLVVGEVALSVVLLVGALLLARSYRALQTTDLGFDQRGILSFRVGLPEAKYGESAKVLATMDQLLNRLRGLPGVTEVGSAQGIPFSGWDWAIDGVTIEGRALPAKVGDVDFQWITPGYFPAIGVPILRGRALAATDRDTIARVAVVNESFAKRVFGAEDPLGHRIKLGDAASPDPWVTIVGVARDFRHYRLPRPMGPAIYMPYAQNPMRTEAIVLRTSLADPLTLAGAVHAVVSSVDPDVPAYQIQTFEEAVQQSLWRQRLQRTALGAFALLALVLAAIGLYGVISYAVTQRTREMGLRMALGASETKVIALVLGEGARLTGVGVALGIAGAFVLERVLSSLLYEVRAADPVSLMAAPLVLGLTALTACYLPARRASRVAPVTAMRGE